MSATLRLDIAPLLLPTLKTILGMYEQKDLQYTEIYETEDSGKDKETVAMLAGTGFASFLEEGQAGSTGSMGVSWVNETVHKQVTQGFSITDLAMRDNQYKKDFPKYAQQLANSLRATKEVLGANLLNQGFDENYIFGDQKPIFATDHPTKVSTFSNKLGAGATADFSELALQQMVLLAQKMPMESGILANIMIEKIVIPPELQFAAEEFDKSHFQPSTANNAVNTIRGRFKYGFVVNHLLTNPEAFFGLTNAIKSRIHYKRDALESFTYVDPVTFTFSARAIERYSFTSNDPRGWVGALGV